jgi:hypothetical protein
MKAYSECGVKIPRIFVVGTEEDEFPDMKRATGACWTGD